MLISAHYILVYSHMFINDEAEVQFYFAVYSELYTDC